MRMPDNKNVSIIICTYNRAELLRECLESLCQQTSDMSRMDVIVVDNNSTDGTAEIVRGFADRLSRLRNVFEPDQGLSHARNRGFREAATEWVAYLDDDARAFPDYVEKFLIAIRKNEFDCIGGVYLPWYKYGRPKWYMDSYGTNAGKAAGLLKDDFASGGNMIIKKDILERFGGFSDRVGMSGKKIAYGEETRLQVMMRQEGLKIGFDPTIRIEHLVSLHKQTPMWFIRSSFAVGRNYWDAFLIPPSFLLVTRSLASTFIKLVKQAFGKLPALFLRRDYYIQNWFIDVFSPVSLAAGLTVGFFAAPGPGRKG